MCDSGIQVTGSHNPKDDNGFKMVLGGRAIYGDEIKALQNIIENESWQLTVERIELVTVKVPSMVIGAPASSVNDAVMSRSCPRIR